MHDEVYDVGSIALVEPSPLERLEHLLMHGPPVSDLLLSAAVRSPVGQEFSFARSAGGASSLRRRCLLPAA